MLSHVAIPPRRECAGLPCHIYVTRKTYDVITMGRSSIDLYSGLAVCASDGNR